MRALPPDQVRCVRNAIILACAVDAADKSLLPATFKALTEHYAFSPKDLAWLVFAQSASFSAATPFWGSLLRYHCARDLLVIGCLLWSVTTFVLAVVTHYWTQLCLRLIVGIALASVNPLGQSIMCDIIREEERGNAFGLLAAFSGAMSMAIGFFTTMFAGETILGVYGWRWAYVLVASLSMLTAGIVHYVVPRESVPPPALGTSWWSEQRRVLKAIANKPSFFIMVAQGVTGGIPWSGFSFLLFYFQISGYTDIEAGSIMFAGALGNIGGSFLGGWLGDLCNKIWPYSGRCAVAQASVVIGMLMFLWTMGVPYGAGSVYHVAIALSMFMLSATWSQAAALRPICGQIFTDSLERAQILSMWLALEGIAASLLGAPLVGWLSEVFGYRLSPGQEIKFDVASRNALRKALVGTSVIPWLLCALAWVPMYWTYPKDCADSREPMLMSQRAKMYGKVRDFPGPEAQDHENVIGFVVRNAGEEATTNGEMTRKPARTRAPVFL